MRDQVQGKSPYSFQVSCHRWDAYLGNASVRSSKRSASTILTKIGLGIVSRKSGRSPLAIARLYLEFASSSVAHVQATVNFTPKSFWIMREKGLLSSESPGPK